MIIAIDFDGTIVEDKYPEIGQLRPKAKEVINQLFRDGHHIIIWTCRAEKALLDCAVFLACNGINIHQINENNTDNVKQYQNDSRKVFADVYVDDKCVAGLPDWAQIHSRIKEINALMLEKEFDKVYP